MRCGLHRRSLWSTITGLLRFFFAAGLMATGITVAAEKGEKTEATSGNTVLVFAVDEGSTNEPLPDGVMKNLVRAVDRRVNPGGLSRVAVRPTGNNRIEVMVPSAEPDVVTKTRRMIETVGSLEFRVLANPAVPEHKVLIERAKALPHNRHGLRGLDSEILASWVPVVRGREQDFSDDPGIASRKVSLNGQDAKEVLVVRDQYNVNGDYLTEARSSKSFGEPSISIAFNSIGAAKFSRLTGLHLPDPERKVQYRLGIILDGWLHSAPFIRSTISKLAEITGHFDQKQVDEFVDVLNAGSLPARLRMVTPDKPVGKY
jgi:SecD/SecF fusion protein